MSAKPFDMYGVKITPSPYLPSPTVMASFQAFDKIVSGHDEHNKELERLRGLLNSDAYIALEHAKSELREVTLALNWAKDCIRNKWRGEGTTFGDEHRGYILGSIDQALEKLEGLK